MLHKEHASILKGVVTQELTMVEYKGKDAFPFKNRIHLMMASNKDFIVPVELEDRRFFIVKVGKEQQKNRSYFEKIKKQLNGGGYEALLYELQNRDLNGVNLLNYPDTDAILESKLRSLNSIMSWVFDGLVCGDLPNTKLNVKDLYHTYVEFTQNLRSRVEPQARWSRDLRLVFPELSTKRRHNAPRHYLWTENDTVEEGRLCFEERVGMSIDWGIYE